MTSSPMQSSYFSVSPPATSFPVVNGDKGTKTTHVRGSESGPTMESAAHTNTMKMVRRRDWQLEMPDRGRYKSKKRKDDERGSSKHNLLRDGAKACVRVRTGAKARN